MKIAQVSPLTESVPPQSYGGTERVVSWLTEELVKQGHDVTLFASGDSCTSANLVPIGQKALRLNEECRDGLLHHFLLMNEVMRRTSEFDIIHSHLDYLLYPLLRLRKANAIHTLHGRLDLPDLIPLYQEFSDMPVVSISYSQRDALPIANYVGNIYHGLPRSLYSLNEYPQDYLLFLGRICPEKRPDRAIEIARRAGKRLVIAAKVDPVDREYFEQKIRPLLKESHVDYVGEVTEVEKPELIGNACATVFPIDWPEPFGLVMIESLACGTPLIAFDNGSVREIIEHGKSGFICQSMDDAITAIDQVSQIKRSDCRLEFEERFTVERMAKDYMSLYSQFATINDHGEVNERLPIGASDSVTVARK